MVGHRQTLETSSLWQRWLEQAPNLSLADVENLPAKGPSKRSSGGGPSGHPPRGPSGGPSGGSSNGAPRDSSGQPSRGKQSGPSSGKNEKKKGRTKENGKQKGSHESKEGLAKDGKQSTKILGSSELPSQAKASSEKPKGHLGRSRGDGLTMERKKVK